MDAMTEEEAKTKWCPFVKPDYRGPDRMLCIGSACMAWRWGDVICIRKKPKPDDTRWLGPFPFLKGGKCWLRESDQGFCGLAGKP